MRKIWQLLFVRSWWVWAFALLCYAGYDLGSSRQAHKHAKLQRKISAKERELELALAEGEELHRQLQSQSDPAWIEMVLMRELGMVPEGQTKAVFR